MCLSFIVGQSPGRRGSLWSSFGYLSYMAHCHGTKAEQTACPLHSSFYAGGYEDVGSSKNETTRIRTEEIVTESLPPHRNMLALADCRA